MRVTFRYLLLGFLILPLIITLNGCRKVTSTDSNESKLIEFAREDMLTFWADSCIISSYDLFYKTLQELESSAKSFTSLPEETTLQGLREKYRKAYISFQKVAMFEIGQAEKIGYRTNMNSYPTDTLTMKKTVESGNYNLALPSLRDIQGLPAIDYLLFGVASTSAGVVTFYNNSSSEKYKKYLKDIVERMIFLTREVQDSWKNGYREQFIANRALSSLSSISKLTNDYIFYYEKFLRAGKVGIPAGIFTGKPLPSKIEGIYSKTLSRALLEASINNMYAFFNGHFSTKGISYKHYLDYLSVTKSGDLLSKKINKNFTTIIAKVKALNIDLEAQIKTDKTALLDVYDELQKNLVLLKIDMLQALSITVDYVDADGD